MSEPTTIQMHVNPKLIEELAKLEHDQWMEWASTLMAKEQLSEARCERWQKFMVPYAELPEEVKEFDRVWARKSAAVILKYILLGKSTAPQSGEGEPAQGAACGDAGAPEQGNPGDQQPEGSAA